MKYNSNFLLSSGHSTPASLLPFSISTKISMEQVIFLNKCTSFKLLITNRHVKAAYLTPFSKQWPWFGSFQHSYFWLPLLTTTAFYLVLFTIQVSFVVDLSNAWIPQYITFLNWLLFSFCISSLHQISCLAPGNAILYKPVKLPLLNTC